MQLGAQQELKPLPLPAKMALLESVPDAPVLADNSGIVYKVCDERVTDLKSYLDGRHKCENGEVLLLRAVSRKDGPELDMVKVMHESDAAYSAAFVHLLVNGEAAEREKRAIEGFGVALKGESNANLATWLMGLNQAYARLPNSLKRSERVRKVFAEHDSEVSQHLGQLAELKLAMTNRHTSDLESFKGYRELHRASVGGQSPRQGLRRSPGPGFAGGSRFRRVYEWQEGVRRGRIQESAGSACQRTLRSKQRTSQRGRAQGLLR